MTTVTEPWVLRFPGGFTVKDARGFNIAGGTLGRSLAWPLPPTSAGAARSAIGDAAGWFLRPLDADWPALLDAVALGGPLAVARDAGDPAASWSPVFPAPQDALGFAKRLVWLEPKTPTAGARVKACWSDGDVAQATDALWRPALDTQAKPTSLPAWWSFEDGIRWLLEPGEWSCGPHANLLRQSHDVAARMDLHLAIEPQSQTALSGALFGIETRETLGYRASTPREPAKFIEVGLRMAVSRRPLTADGPLPPAPPAAWRFGGEGRLAEARRSECDPWAYPAKEYSVWQVSRFFRLMLVTPGSFGGWLPPGFAATKEPDGEVQFRGEIQAGEATLRVTLRSAAIPRPTPVSGWDFAAPRPGPKATRLLVPAGSIYYFEADAPVTEKELRDLWLASLQPDGQDRRDGFGLVVPGAWPISSQTTAS